MPSPQRRCPETPLRDVYFPESVIKKTWCQLTWQHINVWYGPGLHLLPFWMKKSRLVLTVIYLCRLDWGVVQHYFRVYAYGRNSHVCTGPFGCIIYSADLHCLCLVYIAWMTFYVHYQSFYRSITNSISENVKFEYWNFQMPIAWKAYSRW